MGGPLNCINLLVTNRCPLNCAHCGSRSGPREVNTLSLEDVVRALDAAQARSCKMVNFSGGEPFILGERLVEMVSAARFRNLPVRVTTGAYWSKNYENSYQRLESLAAAGLNQLVVSCGDMHQAYVPLTNVVIASQAAYAHNLSIYINIGTTSRSKIKMKEVVQSFAAADIPLPLIRESPLIPFGRGKEGILANNLLLRSVSDLSGPCPSMTKNPTVHPDGTLSGCASILSRGCRPLTFGNIHQAPINSLIGEMDSHPLAAWIHKVGVVELKYLIEANTSLRFQDEYVNICHLCGDLLHNRDAVDYLKGIGIG